jgi:hypothetical protein
MNELRRKIIFVGGVAAIPMSTGCVTAALMSGNDERETYTETVSSVLVSADGKTLAVLGQDFHYLFDAPEIVKAVLQSELRNVVEASFNSFLVDASQHINGNYKLRIAKNASPEQQEKALSAGFKANGVQAIDASQKLRKEYKVNISAEKSAGAKAAKTASKLLLTPITLAADGILILAALPLLLIIVAASK